MTAPATVARTPLAQPRMWVAAGAEIVVAAVVALLLLRGGGRDDMGHASSHMHSDPATLDWRPTILIIGVAALVVFLWWLRSRRPLAAASSALSLTALAATAEARTLAVQSHLAAMLLLEVTMVAVPLLIITAVPSSAGNPTPRSRRWRAMAVLAVVLNPGWLIMLHLPGIHALAAAMTGVPLWTVVLTTAIGLIYWYAILGSAGHVDHVLRRRAFILGQEVSAILGLAALLWPAPAGHSSPFGMPAATDHRLGGALMLLTCAAVPFAVLKRLDAHDAARTD